MQFGWCSVQSKTYNGQHVDENGPKPSGDKWNDDVSVMYLSIIPNCLHIPNIFVIAKVVWKSKFIYFFADLITFGNSSFHLYTFFLPQLSTNIFINRLLILVSRLDLMTWITIKHNSLTLWIYSILLLVICPCIQWKKLYSWHLQSWIWTVY